MESDTYYSSYDYEMDNAAFFSKKQEEPFLHKFKNVLYPNPEFLSNSIPDNISSHRVNLCIFYIETICVLPFIKYALLKNDTDKTVGFVEFETGNVDDDNLEKTVIDKFELLFRKGFQNDAFNSYKGFVVRENDIYMFFDITSLLERNHELNSNFIYGVAHELCQTKTLFDYRIGQNIQNLFDVDEDIFPKCAILSPWFYNLDGILELIDVPKIAYICGIEKKKKTETLVSLTHNDLSEIYVPSDSLFEYEDYGFLYYFSENLIDPIENELYIRFVVFPMEVKQKNQIYDYNSVTFKIGKTTVWGIKSIDQFIPI